MKGFFMKAADGIIVLLVVLVVMFAYSNIKSFGNPGNIPYVGGYCVLNVLSNSMSPGIKAGDAIVVHKISPHRLKIGDIVTFFVTDYRGKKVLLTHRIIDIVSGSDEITLKTQGDANSVEDNIPVHEGDIVGKCVYHIPWLGRISQFIQNPFYILLFIIFPLLLLLFSECRSIIRRGRRSLHQDNIMVRDENNG